MVRMPLQYFFRRSFAAVFSVLLVAAPGQAQAPQPVMKDALGDPLPAGAVARLGTLRFRGRITYSMAYSPDGKVLATGNTDFTVRIWEAETGRELRRFPFSNPADNQASAVSKVAFSPDGRVLGAAGSPGGGGQRFWLWKTGEELAPEQAGDLPRLMSGPVRSYAAGAKTFARMKGDSVVVEETGSAKTLLEVNLLNRPGQFALSPDGRRLAVADAEFTIHLWDVPARKELGRCKGNRTAAASLAFAPDGKTLAAGATMDLEAQVWDVATAKMMWKYRTTGATIYAVQVLFSPDGKTVAAAGWDGTVRLLDAATGKERNPAPGNRTWVNALAFSPDGKSLFTGCEDRSLRQFETATGKEVRLWKEPVFYHYSFANKQMPDPPDWIQALVCYPSGKYLAEGTSHGLYLWDLPAGKKPRALADVGPANSVAFSGDGRWLAAAHPGVQLWDVAAGRKVLDLAPAGAWHRSVAFSPRGALLAAGGQEGAVRLWDIHSGKEVRRFDGHRGTVHSLAFSPCGRLLASAASDWSVRLWEVATGQERMVLAGKRSMIDHLRFAPIGQVLAFGGTDKVVHLLDAATGEEFHQFKGHDGWITALAFSPDGRLLASGSYDTTALIWDVGKATAALARKAKPLPERELQALWHNLGQVKGRDTQQAIRALISDPAQTVALLNQLMMPVATESYKRIPQLLRDLDSESFAEREHAMKALETLGEPARAALAKAVEKPPSLEFQRRAEMLLKKMGDPGASPEQARVLRAVEILEAINTPAARRLLDRLAQGAAEATLTEEARAALNRLRR